MFDHHRFGRDFSLSLQRKFLLLLCLWIGLGHKLLHAKFTSQITSQITSQLELKEITLQCSKSEYRTQLNYKGSVLNF